MTEDKSHLSFETHPTGAGSDVVDSESQQRRQYATSPRGSFGRLARRLALETGGIQRVTDADRQLEGTTHAWQACTMWLSANMAVATVSTGMVGPSMGLDFRSSAAIIVIINVFTCLLPAWTATFGLTGLRMTTFSRYSFGYWGNLLVVVFSLISTTGWNAVNSISGASCLAALSNGALPAWAGVIIITVIVWLICVLGISWIHRVNTFVWISPLIVWCVASGTGASSFSAAAVPAPKGPNGAASAISFMAVIFSFAVSWINCAADYNVRMPTGTSRRSIFLATYIGIAFPAILVQLFGAALYTGAQTDPAWRHAYQEFGVGGPLLWALKPAGGFGKFLVVLAALSAIPNNIPNNYSFALHAQNFGPWAIRVPRIVFVTFGFIAATIVGCLASLSFETSLTTVLSIVGYWTVIHIMVVAEEHVFFRRWGDWSAYDFDAWDQPAKLPFGWAAIGAFAFGFLGAAMGMKTGWYVGPVAKLVGAHGANLGHVLTGAFAGLVFPAFRWAEKRWTGR